MTAVERERVAAELLDVLAAPEVGALVSQLADKDLRKSYAGLLARIVRLRDDRRPPCAARP